jgi:hypothetical protein
MATSYTPIKDGRKMEVKLHSRCLQRIRLPIKCNKCRNNLVYFTSINKQHLTYCDNCEETPWTSDIYHEVSPCCVNCSWWQTMFTVQKKPDGNLLVRMYPVKNCVYRAYLLQGTGLRLSDDTTVWEFTCQPECSIQEDGLQNSLAITFKALTVKKTDLHTLEAI